MSKSQRGEVGWRGSAESWLQAAYDCLTDSGVDAVRIMPLANSLKLSRTSFYWFFKDRDQLLAALIERWRAKNTGNLTRQTQAYAETITEAILNLFDCWLNTGLFDSRLEFAMRSWAQQSATVAQEIEAADNMRLEAIKKMFLRFDYAPVSADVRSRTIYLTQIGYISKKSTEDLDTRMSRIPQYVEIFSGLLPTQSELDRFFARHGYHDRARGRTAKRPKMLS